MKWQQLLVDIYRRLSTEFEEVLDGLSLDDLNQRPAPDANTIGWLLWHTTRSLDRTVGDVMYGEQLWTRDKWHEKFNRPPDPNDTGYRHSIEDVAALYIPDVQTLLDYHHAVMEPSVKYLMNLTEDGLDREFDNSIYPGTMTAVNMRIMGNINDCYQHVGQAAYVRGLLKGQGWLGR
jgi:hypothetical protein